MEDLKTALMQVKEHINNLRSIEYTLGTEYFKRLWSSDKEQREVAKKIIKEGSLSKLKKWMRHHPDLELGELSSRQLKERARTLKIQNYSRLNKLALINEIEEILNEQKGSS